MFMIPPIDTWGILLESKIDYLTTKVSNSVQGAVDDFVVAMISDPEKAEEENKCKKCTLKTEEETVTEKSDFSNIVTGIISKQLNHSKNILETEEPETEIEYIEGTTIRVPTDENPLTNEEMMELARQTVEKQKKAKTKTKSINMENIIEENQDVILKLASSIISNQLNINDQKQIQELINQNKDTILQATKNAAEIASKTETTATKEITEADMAVNPALAAIAQQQMQNGQTPMMTYTEPSNTNEEGLVKGVDYDLLQNTVIPASHIMPQMAQHQFVDEGARMLYQQMINDHPEDPILKQQRLEAEQRAVAMTMQEEALRQLRQQQDEAAIQAAEELKEHQETKIKKKNNIK